MPETARRAYRLREIEQMLGLSRMGVRRAIDSGTFSTFKVGRAVFVPAEDVDQLINSATTKAA